ncbi:phosphotransferase enzyme family protein [Paraburkholderia bannensis]|uniref:phosphotransferase enzyme family protein n=1 Tax=Paraburkholderia bannensis TaxID=765414 RepID=UPI002ABD88EA|nr:phosphotransferase [Paraburkholderia bannensis]
MANFDAICAAYGIAHDGAPRQVSERVWYLSDGHDGHGGVAVKLYADEHAARAQKEAAILAHLQAHGDARFRVQSLQRTLAGEALYVGHDVRALVTRWVPGQTRTYDTFTSGEWEALGASLGALHVSLDSFDAFDSSSLSALDTLRARLAAIDADGVRRGLTEALGRDRANLHDYVETSLRLLDAHYPGSLAAFPADDPQHPIHNDYNQFNYLFDGALPPLILDWEAAIGAPREYELVRCLNHLPLEAPHHAAAFVRAYARVRAPRPQNIAWAVDAACLQHALKLWIVQGWLNDPARFAAHLRGATTMVAAFDGARERLIDFYSRCLESGDGRTPT